MKEYTHKDIRIITCNCIIFKDGFHLNFSECIEGWAVEHNISITDNKCIGQRDITKKPPYFIFYSKCRVIISFKSCWGAKRKFTAFNMKLNSMGYSVYDLS